MNIDNGRSFTDPLTKQDLTQVVAQSMASALHGPTPKSSATREPSQEPSWPMFASTLDRLVSSNAELKAAVEETIARNARQALAAGDGPLPSTEEFLAMLRSPPVVGKGGTFASAFWWGFNVYVSHEDLSIFLASGGPLTVISGTFGTSIGGPAAPFIAALAAFVLAVLGLLKALDQGRGVYISMSWFAPGIFVPTTA